MVSERGITIGETKFKEKQSSGFVLQGLYSNMRTKGITLTAMTIKQILLSRRVALTGLMAFLPVIVTLYFVVKGPGDIPAFDFFNYLIMLMYVQFLLLFITLIYGVSLIGDDVEDQTFTYLLIRPISRQEVVLYKYFGLVISMLVLFFPSLMISFFVVGYSEGGSATMDHLDDLGGFMGVFMLAIASYGALYTFFGLSLRRPLLVGLIFTFFWELLLTNIPTPIRKYTIMFYLRSFSLGFVEIEGFSQEFNLSSWQTGLSMLIIVTLFCLFLSFVFIGRKEFH